MKFEFVPPAQLRPVWPTVRRELKNILKKSPEDWIPEDVYADLREGRALLFQAKDDDRTVGGAVLRPQGVTLLAWAVWGVAGYREEAIRELKTVARNVRCTEILFETKRRGWDKVAPKLGFRPRSWLLEV